MRILKLRVYFSLLVIVVIWMSVISLQDNLSPVMNEIVVDGEGIANEQLKIAFITDIHFQNDEADFVRYEKVLRMLVDVKPDLILLGGDYIDMDAENIEYLRPKVVKALDRLAVVAPTYGVFGNHELYTGELSWYQIVKQSKIRFMHNEVEEIGVNGNSICLRGLGDFFTDRYKSLPFPDDCNGFKVTVTHDPYVAEIDPEGGLYLAGHTHCGQIVLPFIGAPWTPTRASEEYHCGIGSTEDRVWVTSAGIGTTSIPFRLGTQSGFEVISILKQ
jgi:predicted MPP superfamily phosphohydrolase